MRFTACIKRSVLLLSLGAAAGCGRLLGSVAMPVVAALLSAAWVLGACGTLGLGILLSASGLLLEEMGFHLYPRSRHVARLALLADRMARPFLLAVLLAALGAAAWWWADSPAHALMVAVSVLIVTCPCALSLATPAAMLAAAGQLARQGILVRELQSLEALTQVDTVVFDKTGTLTRDGQRLDRQWTAPGVDERLALRCAASLARHSWHPLSRALVQAWQAEAATQAVAAEPGMPVWDSVTESPGRGLEGVLSAAPNGGAPLVAAPQGRWM